MSPISEEKAIITGRTKPIVAILKYKWLVLLITIAVIGLGVPVASKFGASRYEAIATILVSPKFIPNLTSERGMDLGSTQYKFYIKQQINMIKRSDILKETLQIPIVQKNWLHDEESIELAVERLQSSIKIKNKRGTPFLNVSLVDKKSPNLDIILDAVIGTYLKKNKAENLYDSDGRIVRLKQRRQKLENLIVSKRQSRTKIAEELGVTTFKEKSLNPYDDILIESTSAFRLAQRTKVEAKTRLDSLTDRRIGGKTILDVLVNEMVVNDSILKSHKVKLQTRRTELLTQMASLTEQHPSYNRAKQEIAKIERDIKQATEELAKDSRERLLGKNQAEIYQAQSIEDSLKKELDKQRNRAKHYSTLYNTALVTNKEISRIYRQLDKIQNQIDFLTIESDAPGFVRLDTPASTYLKTGKRKQILLISVFVALGLGIGIAILLDLLDNRIKTPGEVHKILGFPPIAWLLETNNNKDIEQLANDYLRRMALALERDWHVHDTDCFVITSVKPGAGATKLTLQLAHILSELGVRTLALEMNAFNSDERYKEGTTSKQGLTTLLSSNNSLAPELLIIPATGKLPDRLPIGEIQSRHLNTHGKLLDVLKQLKNHYDLIIIDTPPLLLSADAELLGKVAGGVLLVVEAEIITPGELRRAASLLERLNPPVVGAILNRVKVFRGGGYFGDLIEEYRTGNKKKSSWIKRLLWK
ncbi:hypothetical protein QUF50_06315 [Thiotrichales bacterium HSG1]|nr:hypothetical protein [Thiotrichales bacterium HSG1]